MSGSPAYASAKHLLGHRLELVVELLANPSFSLVEQARLTSKPGHQQPEHRRPLSWVKSPSSHAAPGTPFTATERVILDVITWREWSRRGAAAGSLKIPVPGRGPRAARRLHPAEPGRRLFGLLMPGLDVKPLLDELKDRD